MNEKDITLLLNACNNLALLTTLKVLDLYLNKAKELNLDVKDTISLLHEGIKLVISETEKEVKGE